jgi:hypothetical protein
MPRVEPTAAAALGTIFAEATRRLIVRAVVIIILLLRSFYFSITYDAVGYSEFGRHRSSFEFASSKDFSLAFPARLFSHGLSLRPSLR